MRTSENLPGKTASDDGNPKMARHEKDEHIAGTEAADKGTEGTMDRDPSDSGVPFKGTEGERGGDRTGDGIMGNGRGGERKAMGIQGNGQARDVPSMGTQGRGGGSPVAAKGIQGR